MHVPMNNTTAVAH